MQTATQMERKKVAIFRVKNHTVSKWITFTKPRHCMITLEFNLLPLGSAGGVSEHKPSVLTGRKHKGQLISEARRKRETARGREREREEEGAKDREAGRYTKNRAEGGREVETNK